MTQYRIAVIPGDGIGREVIPEGLRVLQRVADLGLCSFDLVEFPWSYAWHRDTGGTTPSDLADVLRGFDALYFGAMGLGTALSVDAPATGGRGGINFLGVARRDLRNYVNLRPVRLYAGTESPLRNPGAIDFVIVRENNEGEYANAGGSVYEGLEDEVATQVIIVTHRGAERVFRFAFELARKRNGKKHVWCVTKSNALRHALTMWDQVFSEVSKDYPDIGTSISYVDAMAMYLVTRPEDLDVVVTTNLMGDILSDEAAAITGSIGLAGSANVNPDRTSPGLFEPCHGSAPDIAGRGIANPIAAINSAAMMLDWLGESRAAAELVTKAIEGALASGEARTVDMGGTAKTTEVAEAILARMQ